MPPDGVMEAADGATEAFCLMLLAATPAALVAALNLAVREAVEQPVVRERLARPEMAPMVP